MERTDTPPPGNAMWMLRNFPRGVSPAEVLRHPSASSWRVQGEASWEVLFEEIDRAVQAHLYRAMAM